MNAEDVEIASWLVMQPRNIPFPVLASQCADRFGGAAWGEDRIRSFILRLSDKTRRPRAVSGNPEMVAFINERIGTMPYAKLAEECRARYGQEAPSKSALHRHRQRMAALLSRLPQIDL